MSSRATSDGELTHLRNVVDLSPEQVQRITEACAAASPATEDDTWRLADGTPVTESEYFAWVAEIRANGGA